MQKKESRQSRSAQNLLAVILGAVLSLGVELLLLLLGAAAVSAGILRVDAAMQVTAAACLVGSFVGGSFACRSWKSHRLPAGLLTGSCCFLLILLGALIGGNFEFGTQALIELAGCAVGGGLAGLLASQKKRKRKKSK